MSYQVLARKWRPRTFRELVGQEHVLRALVNALDHDRLHHAYLFTGTRGVGKTTIARVLAKSLNCESGVSSEPCGRCSACLEIDEGRFVDLIEVDAASRTKVDETRELLENVQYTPTRGRYKVYLIDEVHMFSNHSFNALLKTLEEPPPHVKFLLATTDPQKLPVTILSRCLQFNLNRLPQARIEEHLRHILEEEAIEAEAGALRQLARAADGSMRDALSLLDQAIAYGGGRVLETEVRAMLGTIDRSHVLPLLQGLADADAEAVLAGVERAAEQSPDFHGLLLELLSLLQQIAVAQSVPQVLDDTLEEADELRALAERMAPEDVQLFYQIGLIGRRDLPLAPDPRSGLEMTLLRMLVFRPAARVAEPSGESRPAPAGGAARPSQAARAALAGARPTGRKAAAPPEAKPREAAGNRVLSAQGWRDVVPALGLRGMANELAQNCAFLAREGNRIRLALDPGHRNLLGRERESRLGKALSDYLGSPVQVVVELQGPAEETPAQAQARARDERQQQAVRAIEEDTNVQALREAFEARVRPDTIKPLD